ncbi:hypothetical protein N665_0214s0037, partial [Sinapis alba]
ANIGGWTPIRDVKDPHIVEIGKFAVSEYDKQNNLGLRFVEVLSGESQVVSGMNYRLIVSVNEGKTKKYKAVVWEKPSKSMTLKSFEPAGM